MYFQIFRGRCPVYNRKLKHQKANRRLRGTYIKEELAADRLPTVLWQLWQRILGASQGMLQVLYKDILDVFTTLATAGFSVQFWGDSWHVPLCSYWYLLGSCLALCFSFLFFGVAFCFIILDSWCCGPLPIFAFLSSIVHIRRIIVNRL